jgi:hypothetical protein
MNKDAEVIKYFPRTLTDWKRLKRFNKSTNIEKHHFGLFAVDNKEFIGYTGFFVRILNPFLRPVLKSAGDSKRKYGVMELLQKPPSPV